MLPFRDTVVRSRRQPDVRVTFRTPRQLLAQPHAGVAPAIVVIRHDASAFRNPFRGTECQRSNYAIYLGAAYRNRTDDLRITRGLRPGRPGASCTDSTDHRTDGTHGAGNIRSLGPRTGPRPGPHLALPVTLCNDAKSVTQACEVFALPPLVPCSLVRCQSCR